MTSNHSAPLQEAKYIQIENGTGLMPNQVITAFESESNNNLHNQVEQTVIAGPEGGQLFFFNY